MFREVSDGPTKLMMEDSGYSTVKIRVTQSGRGIGVVWEGKSKTKARTIFDFLATQPEIVWMHLKHDHRSH